MGSRLHGNDGAHVIAATAGNDGNDVAAGGNDGGCDGFPGNDGGRRE